MTERSMPWNGPADGSGTGDADMASYDAHNEWAAFTVTISGAGARTNKGGVSFGERSDYEATVVGGAVRVQPGTGICHGQWHDSDANVDVAIPTPVGATRIDRIVLRKDWAAQTVRITRIAGVEGGGTPALVQTAGTTWDVPLWNASITTSGTITLTSTRQGLAGDIGGSLPAAINVGDTGTAGVSGIPSSSDHEHPFPAPNTVAALPLDGTSTVGVSTEPAREDHVHETPKIFSRKKGGNETLGNSTVLQNDDDLTFPVVSGETYIFRGAILYNGGVDFKLAFNLPGGSTLRWGALGPDETTPSTIKGETIAVVDGALTWGSVGSGLDPLILEFSGSCVIGANGTFVARWAKATPDADSTVVYVGSNLLAHEIG